MSRIRANDPKTSPAFDETTVHADFFNRRFHLHAKWITNELILEHYTRLVILARPPYGSS
jgi:hypothetical protein